MCAPSDVLPARVGMARIASRFDIAARRGLPHRRGDHEQVSHALGPRCTWVRLGVAALRMTEEPLGRRPSGRRPADDSKYFHGEFDPGSGRTLAACLTHASGATNQASAWGKAANG